MHRLDRQDIVRPTLTVQNLGNCLMNLCHEWTP
jgi:hypothetical protein